MEKKKVLTTGKIVLFVFLAILIIAAIVVRNNTIKAVDVRTNLFIEDVITNNSDNYFVKNGLDLNNASTDIAEVNNTVSGILNMFPSANDLGLPKFLYDILISNVRTRLNTLFTTADNTVNKLSGLTDSDGFLTVSSLINSVRNLVVRIINIVFLVIVAILLIILIINVIKLLAAFNKEKKRLAGAAQTESVEPALAN